MGPTYFSAVGLLKARYKGKGVRTKKGNRFSSKKCAAYMREGSVFLEHYNKSWRVRTDAYYSDLKYTVYVSYLHKPSNRLRATRSAIESRSRTQESLDKL